MRKIIVMIVILVGGYVYLDTYFDRNDPPPLCLISEAEMSAKMSDVYKDVGVDNVYVLMGVQIGESMVMNMRKQSCSGRPLTTTIPEKLAYELKKLQRGVR